MTKKNPSKASFESKSMNCSGCGEKVKHVDTDCIAVLCWKCSPVKNLKRILEEKKRDRNGS
jgi:hypothetical protein